jgi:hypothetical protein
MPQIGGAGVWAAVGRCPRTHTNKRLVQRGIEEIDMGSSTLGSLQDGQYASACTRRHEVCVLEAVQAMVAAGASRRGTRSGVVIVAGEEGREAAPTTTY